MANSLVDFLEANAVENPGLVAVSYQAERVTYGDLWVRVKILANYLLSRGLRKSERVALILQNSPEYIYTYYAIIAAGGVVVSLNTAAKSRELSNWIKHSGSQYLVIDATHPEFSKVVNNFDGVVIVSNRGGDNSGIQQFKCLEDIVCKDAEKQDKPSLLLDGDSPAAIIYTSGTTGSPKGVTLSHANLVSNTQSILKYLRLTKRDSILNILPFYYSYGNSVLHTHIAAGAKIVLQNSMVYPKLILESIEREAVSGFSGVPSTFALLLSRTKIEDYNLSSLRYITQAGGPMPPAHIHKLLNEIPGIEFFVMYGQTEATARLSYLPPEKLKEKMGSIGIAIPGVSLEIRIKSGEKAGIGEIGEIYAKGNNIMMGYWQDQDKTNQTIIEGWLKTGDLAHYDKDKYIYIDGRSSEIIKTGGNRVSPKDIEEVLSSIGGVAEAAVIGVDDDIMGQVIKAYVVLSEINAVSKKDILKYCKDELAVYKIPKYIEFIDDLPKTQSGKVKRFILEKL